MNFKYQVLLSYQEIQNMKRALLRTRSSFEDDLFYDQCCDLAVKLDIAEQTATDIADDGPEVAILSVEA